ncbi:MAG TPA: hypothetical protein VMC43_02155 [Candidatus Paceibacterota bacterium]|nr:hypothetical protein [Candidatus Paceibacterota bacterium]
MKLFQRESQFFELSKPSRWRKHFEILVRCALMLLFPVPFAAASLAFWYFAFYQRGIHFMDGAEGIATAAWIPTFGILYALVAATVLESVWEEYKTMRTAIKKYDFNTFADLRDEEVSPLIHTTMFVLSAAVLGGFMGLKYPDFTSGAFCVTTTAYLIALIFFVIVEIDNPFSGLWFIKNVHDGWLETDVKEWRARRVAEAKKAFHEKRQDINQRKQHLL